jgi:SAM-dependent methyltransferase
MSDDSSLAAYFDGWYADMAVSPLQDDIAQRHLGLPPDLLSTSLLTWDGIAEVVGALRLPAGGLLVDLACGRGGYGLEIGRRTEARLVGVDFSEQALTQARGLALQADQPAEFHCADMTATGLPEHCADGVVCVDAIQFAEEPQAAYAEMRRLLVPGGRVVLTGWQPLNRQDARVPQRLHRVDLAADLSAAGFEEVVVESKSDWRAAERAMWREAAALDPGGDPALQSFHEEGVRAADLFGLIDRVMASATAPRQS